MAKVKLNPVLEAIHGRVGDLVFKEYNHHDIVTRLPDRTGIEPTANQVAQQDKFRLAVLYGKAVMADPEAKEIYDMAAADRGMSAFALSVGDFLVPPAIDEIDLSAYTGQVGQPIRIRASDDMEVRGVTITIRSQAGAVLEQGAATQTVGTGVWAYTTTTALAQGQSVSIEVGATDRPGHKSTRTQTRN